MEPEISQAMVYGDKHPHIVALLVPDDEWLKAWAVEAGKSPLLADAAQDKDLLGALRPAIHQINEKLSNIEKVRRFIIADEPFTIDNAQMTPTMKVRRHKLKEVMANAWNCFIVNFHTGRHSINDTGRVRPNYLKPLTYSTQTLFNFVEPTVLYL